ncbi:MAG: hypothetical protein AB1485_09610 [Candidatus Thermoplasmatota archaeon]
MNKEIENYLKEVNFYMLVVKKKKRKEILEELRTHLLEKTRSFGNLNAENVNRAIKELGSPKELASNYKELYGYSASWILGFAVFASFISLLTLPALEFISAVFLPLAFLYIIYVSLVAGRKAGLVIGSVCGTVRVVALSLLLAVYPRVYTIQTPLVTICAFVFVSVIMALLGYLPGYYKEEYKKGVEESFI